MAKDREKACIFYLNEGNCKKGHKGTFNKKCQTCKDYQALRNGVPRRQNLKKKKQDKWSRDIRNFTE